MLQDPPVSVTGLRGELDLWSRVQAQPGRGISPGVGNRRRVHDLCHNAATIWIQNGVDIKAVQNWLNRSHKHRSECQLVYAGGARTESWEWQSSLKARYSGARPVSSVGQSTALVKRGSSVRIRHGALRKAVGQRVVPSIGTAADQGRNHRTVAPTALPPAQLPDHFRTQLTSLGLIEARILPGPPSWREIAPALATTAVRTEAETIVSGGATGEIAATGSSSRPNMGHPTDA